MSKEKIKPWTGKWNTPSCLGFQAENPNLMVHAQLQSVWYKYLEKWDSEKSVFINRTWRVKTQYVFTYTISGMGSKFRVPVLTSSGYLGWSIPRSPLQEHLSIPQNHKDRSWAHSSGFGSRRSYLPFACF